MNEGGCDGGIRGDWEMGCMKLDVVLIIEGGCMDYGKEVHDMEKKCMGWDGMAGWNGMGMQDESWMKGSGYVYDRSTLFHPVLEKY